MEIFLDGSANPVLTVPVDLGATLDLDAGRAWVGFVGATGGGWQNHDIQNWQYSLLVDTTTTVAIEDASVIEGDAGTTDMVFTVNRLGDTTGTTTVNWTSADDTAVAGSDYVADLGQVVFNTGESQQTIAVTLNGDVDLEAHETFLLNLSGTVGGNKDIDKIWRPPI